MSAELKVDAMIAAAREQTGLSDLGDDSILEPLERLVEALNTEARLNERGVQSVQGNLVATLANRMRVEHHLAQHP